MDAKDDEVKLPCSRSALDKLGQRLCAELVAEPDMDLLADILVCYDECLARAEVRIRQVVDRFAREDAFLVLSPAFGVQYLAWAVAAAYLLDIWSATLYNVLGGLLLLRIYTYWDGGVPPYLRAKGEFFTALDVAALAVLWTVLIAALIRGASRMISSANDLDISKAGRREGDNSAQPAEADEIAGGSTALR